MGHAGLTTVLAAVAALALACGDGSASPGDAAVLPASRHAVLQPDGLAPLRLRGTGFRPRERVRVTVTPSAGAPIVRRVRANGHGRFGVTFAGISPCAGVEARATGTRGSRASFQLSSSALAC
jgi:hypothetical protein